MAKPARIPDCLSKRDLLYGDTLDEASLIDFGDLYLHKGMLHDALSFFERAGNRERIKKIREDALKGGDLSILARVHEMDGFKLDSPDWEGAAENALGAGRKRYAAEMFVKAGISQRAEEILPRSAPQDTEKEDGADGTE